MEFSVLLSKITVKACHEHFSRSATYSGTHTDVIDACLTTIIITDVNFPRITFIVK